MNAHSQEILVDDDPELRELLSTFLDGRNGASAPAAGRSSARNASRQPTSDVLVIDITPAQIGQAARCRVLHPRSELSALILEVVDGDEETRRRATIDSAEFHAPRPGSRDLYARVLDLRQAYRSFPASNDARSGGTARFAGWRLDVPMRRLSSERGVNLALPPTEFALLLAFLDRPRQVLSREQLVAASRITDHQVSPRTLDVYVSRLRRRLAIESGGAELIATKRGQGYVFNADASFD
jgi:two-component system, OmpR family, response regulator